MNVTIEQAALKAALGPVERATANDRTALMVLKNVLIDATGDRIRLSGTDLTTSVTVTVDGAITEPGRITVEADMLAGLVATLPDGPVTISLVGHLVSVESRGDTSKLRTITADDFPALPEITGTTPVVTMGAEYLSRLIDRVAIAAAKEESRPVLAGIHLRVRDGELHLWAADGFRAAAQRVKLDDPETPASANTVPAVSMRQLARILASAEGTVTLGVTEGRKALVAELDGITWTARIIDGTFPDVRQILPESLATTAAITRETMLTPLKRSLLFTRTSGEKERGVVGLSILAGADDLTPGSIELMANDLSGSDTLAMVDSAVTGPDIKFFANAPYLADALGTFETAQVVIGLNGPTQAIVLRAPGNDDHTQVVMPVVKG